MIPVTSWSHGISMVPPSCNWFWRNQTEVVNWTDSTEIIIYNWSENYQLQHFSKLFFFLLWLGTHQGFRRGVSGAVDLAELSWSLKMKGGRGGGRGRPSSVGLSKLERPTMKGCDVSRQPSSAPSPRQVGVQPQDASLVATQFPSQHVEPSLLECEIGSALQPGVPVVLSWSVSSHHNSSPPPAGSVVMILEIQNASL